MLRSVLGRSKDVCQGLVASTYIRKDALTVSNYLIVAYVPGREFRNKISELLGGFLIANETEYPGYLYIDVVCANRAGLGEAMLKSAEERTQQKGLKGIVLASLPHVVGYYRRLGYFNRENCAAENPALEKAFVTLAKPLIDKYKKDVVKHIYAKEGVSYRKFLDELRKQKLAKKKDCRNVTDCNTSGYVMTKCFSGVKTTTSTRPTIQNLPKSRRSRKRLSSKTRQMHDRRVVKAVKVVKANPQRRVSPRLLALAAKTAKKQTRKSSH